MTAYLVNRQILLGSLRVNIKIYILVVYLEVTIIYLVIVYLKVTII